MASLKTKLSAAMLGLIAAGASAPTLMDQFLDEKEGNSLTAYRDGSKVSGLFAEATRIDGKPVTQGMKLTQAKCDQVNAIDVIRRWHGLIGISAYLDASAESWHCHSVPTTSAPVNASRLRSTSASTPATVKAHVKKFAGGLKTVGRIAACAPITATGR
jgi:lysozyme